MLQSFLNKVKGKDPLWVIGRISSRLIGLLYTPFRKPIRFLAWIFPALYHLKRPTAEPYRRLLVVYDLSSQPFSIGDILIIQEASLILRERRQLDVVDFAIVFNHQNPAEASPTFHNVTKTNAMYHLASILPVAQVNPHLGSLLLFNDHEQLHRFIADNADFYEVWPSAWRYAGRDYLYYSVLNDLIYGYFMERESIPSLPCRPHLVGDAQAFYTHHVWPDIPVTVQVRNNPHIDLHRNMDIETWIDFLNDCNGRYPVKFIIVCSLSEVDDRLRQCANVIIAKDFHTSVEQDLALIHEAAIHMGSSSGMGTMAIFNKNPYFLLKAGLFPNRYKGMIREDPFLRFCFASPFQRFTLHEETSELLINEFSRMWSTIDADGWWTAEKTRHEEQKPLTWLR